VEFYAVMPAMIPVHPSLTVSKRLMDLVFSIAMLILMAPVMVLIAIMVKISSAGPVFYRRSIKGLYGQMYDVLKFRSMVQNAHAIMNSDPVLRAEYAAKLKLKNDPRITAIGRLLRKTSLDELPQLFNVIAGDMSLVGPRMLGDIELARYGHEYREKVLSVKPGITGLWQVSGRHKTSFELRVSLDMNYIDHWSLALDIKILLKTPLAVISTAGAS
jgi:lipopolysaccharide/colanic/teichoic acid biosynthesis glycosyltransferase